MKQSVKPAKKKVRIKKDFALKINMSFDDVLKVVASGAGAKKKIKKSKWLKIQKAFK